MKEHLNDLKKECGKESAVIYQKTLEACKSDTHCLNLSSAGLDQISGKTLVLISKILPDLIELNLSGNQLKSLSPEIESLAKLKTIDLRNNRFGSLSTKFESLINLKPFHFEKNLRFSLSFESSLESIVLSLLIETELIETKEEKLLSALKKVCGSKYVVIYNKTLETFEKKYNSLNLSSLNFDHVPGGALFLIGEILPDLEMLYLNDNQISSLPPEIGSLRNLKKLYLYNNQISSLPTEIGSLTNLEYLNLDSNQISS